MSMILAYHLKVNISRKKHVIKIPQKTLTAFFTLYSQEDYKTLGWNFAALALHSQNGCCVPWILHHSMFVHWLHQPSCNQNLQVASQVSRADMWTNCSLSVKSTIFAGYLVFDMVMVLDIEPAAKLIFSIAKLSFLYFYL